MIPRACEDWEAVLGLGFMPNPSPILQAASRLLCSASRICVTSRDSSEPSTPIGAAALPMVMGKLSVPSFQLQLICKSLKTQAACLNVFLVFVHFNPETQNVLLLALSFMNSESLLEESFASVLMSAQQTL